MVLYNSAKRSRMYEQTINQPQGGGPKKPVFLQPPFTVIGGFLSIVMNVPQNRTYLYGEPPNSNNQDATTYLLARIPISFLDVLNRDGPLQ